MMEERRRLEQSLSSNPEQRPKQDKAPQPAKELPADSGSLRPAKAAPEGLLEEDQGPQGPQRLGRYRLDRLVGSGGMGVVYEAWDETLRRLVAIKVLAPGAQSQLALERFQQEALLTARLNHPHVVVVYEAGQVDGRAFIAMEYVDGETLESWIDQRLGSAALLEGEERETARLRAVARLQHDELRGVCRQLRDVADALHHGHTYTPADAPAPTPIIHRDVKPGNIMIDQHEQSRLLDFGLAKELGVALTVTREALGTPLYMSPEQLFSAKRVSPRSDIYSLGMTLYACVTLARPFELSQPGRLFQQLMHEDPRDPQRLNPALSDDLRTIILKATAKDERERYDSAAALALDLDAFLAGQPISARPPTLAQRARRLARRHKRAVATVAALVVGLAGWTLVDAADAQFKARLQIEERRRVAAEQSQATSSARTLLQDAAMVYELAALSRAEDRDGDRWLTLLNQGHSMERKAFEGLAKVSAAPSTRVRHRALVARIARNDGKAEQELRDLHQKARAAVEKSAIFQSLATRVGALDERSRQGLFQALCGLVPEWRGRVRGLPSTELVSLAAGLMDALGWRQSIAWLGEPERDDWQLPIESIGGALQERIGRLQGLAGAEPDLAESLSRDRAAARVRVEVTDAPPGTEVLIARLEGGVPQQVVARGRPGQVLECEAWGEMIACVRLEGRESRVAFSLPRPGWGTPQPWARLSLAAPPTSAPSGMLLVEVSGTAPFWVDASEVRVSEYARFLTEVAASGHAMCPQEIQLDGACQDHTPRTTRAQHDDAAVTGVDYWDALAYAAWAGKRLPTAEQWEAAAFAGAPAQAEGANLPGYHDGYLWVAAAGHGPTSPCGAGGLVGNVAEWLLRTDLDLPFCEAAGGSWAAELPSAELGYRERFDPGARGEDLGFRCVVPIEIPAAAPADLGLERISPIDGAEMVLVPGGALTLSPDPVVRRYRRRTEPRGQAVLSPYYVDRHVVSNASYATFSAGAGRELRPKLRKAIAEDPAGPASVTWEEARAYAAWAGKRLPTEAELEAASRAISLWRQGPDPQDFRLWEWCQDTWHSSFFQYANLRDPVNRWGSTDHVKRLGASRRRGNKKAAAFRCVSSVRTQEDR